MTYRIDALPDDPIIIAALEADFSLTNDWEVFISELLSLSDDQSAPVFYISDMRDSNIDLIDLITGTSLAAQDSNAVLKHPNIRENLVVTTSKMLALAAKGLNSVTFGHIDVKVFDAMEEALAYCRG